MGVGRGGKGGGEGGVRVELRGGGGSQEVGG